MKHFLLTLSTLALLSLPSAALAGHAHGGHHGDGPSGTHKCDSNGDGFITDADREVRKSKRIDDFFAAADADKDGKLSKAEYTAAKQACGNKKKECAFSNKK